MLLGFFHIYASDEDVSLSVTFNDQEPKSYSLKNSKYLSFEATERKPVYVCFE